MERTKDALEVFVLVLAAFLAVCILGGVVFVGGMVLVASIARAEGADYRDGRWATQRFCANYGWDGICTRYRYQRRSYRPAYREPDSIRYYAAPRYDEEQRDDRQQCKEIRKAVGDQHISIDGAKREANNAWAATVRFHIGEKFLDLSNARRIEYICSRSSIKEAGTAVTTLGQAFHRCELSAVPCAPVSEPIAREER